MKRVVFLLVLLACFATPAFAVIVNPSVKDIPDGGCAANMNTSGCFGEPTVTGYKFVPNEPTVTTCKAAGTQRCRSCKMTYTASGALYSTECAYTSDDAACTCSLQTRGLGCNLTGSCDFTDSL